MKFPFALWTRAIIIKRQFGIKLSIASVRRLLRQMGLSCQKPLFRAYQKNLELIEQWKKSVFPAIKKRAKKMGAPIYFQPMNAQHDYVIRRSKDDMPPAKAFWSMTLYNSANGFFIPNDRKKYSVGENGGVKLNDGGGIEVYVSEKKPESVPEENWLPINRKNENLDVILRLYMPDLEKYKTWTPPKTEMVGGM